MPTGARRLDVSTVYGNLGFFVVTAKEHPANGPECRMAHLIAGYASANHCLATAPVALFTASPPFCVLRRSLLAVRRHTFFRIRPHLQSQCGWKPYALAPGRLPTQSHSAFASWHAGHLSFTTFALLVLHDFLFMTFPASRGAVSLVSTPPPHLLPSLPQPPRLIPPADLLELPHVRSVVQMDADPSNPLLLPVTLEPISRPSSSSTATSGQLPPTLPSLPAALSILGADNPASAMSSPHSRSVMLDLEMIAKAGQIPLGSFISCLQQHGEARQVSCSAIRS